MTDTVQSVELLLFVASGGALGALGRAATGRLITTDFPFATLLVNILGSFGLGALQAIDPLQQSAWMLFAGVGLCGAFTTFSTFILETVLLFRAGLTGTAVLNLVATPALCLLATAAALCFMA